MTDVNTLLNEGRLLCERQQYAEAYALYGQACAVQPDSAIAWCNQGGVAFLMGNYTDAETHYQRAHDIDPSLVEAVHGLIRLRLARRDWIGARSILDSHPATGDNELDAEWHYLKGVACENLGEIETAIAAYRDAISRRYAPAQRILLRLLLQQQQILEALDLCFAMASDAKTRWELIAVCLRGSDSDAAAYDRAAQFFLASHQWAYAARVTAHARRALPNLNLSAWPALKGSSWF